VTGLQSVLFTETGDNLVARDAIPVVGLVDVRLNILEGDGAQKRNASDRY
jgi:hypothetical protein